MNIPEIVLTHFVLLKTSAKMAVLCRAVTVGRLMPLMMMSYVHSSLVGGWSCSDTFGRFNAKTRTR